MKIGYMCGFDNLGCGESEARIRWTYLLEKRGHTVIPLNRKGYTFDTNVHANNLSLDLILTDEYNSLYSEIIPLCIFSFIDFAYSVIEL